MLWNNEKFIRIAEIGSAVCVCVCVCVCGVGGGVWLLRQPSLVI